MALVVVVYSPQLYAPFELQDDHRIIDPYLRADAHGAVAAWISEVKSDFFEVGRFRPVSQVFDVIGPRVLGPRPLLWHSLSLLLAGAVTALLLKVGMRVFGAAGPAALFAVVTMLAPDPGPSAAWYRLGPKEAWGMLFLALTLLAMTRAAGSGSSSREAAAVGAAALCAYSKESFLILLPALFLVRLWLEMRARRAGALAALSSLRGAAASHALLFVVGITLALVAARNAGPGSYGGSSVAGLPADAPAIVWSDLTRAPSLAVWFIPAVLGLLPGPVRLAGPGRVTALLAFVAWVVPQYALHATRGGFWDHYWLPCVVGFAAVNAAGWAALERSDRRRLRLVAAMVIIVWTANAARIGFTAAWNFAARARVQQDAVHLAARHVAVEATLLVLATPAQQGEVASSFAKFVRFEGGRYGQALMLDPACSSPACRARDVESFRATALPSKIGVVVHLTPVGHRHGLAWLVPTEYHRLIARGNAVFFSLRSLHPVRIPFSITVDVRKGA